MLDVSSIILLCSSFIFHLSFLDYNLFLLFACNFFFLDEEVVMPTCNLFETIHNIWLQQSSKRGTCFFIAMFNDFA